MEEKLHSRLFIRIQRCRIVNSHSIASISAGGDQTLLVELKGGVRMTGGRQFKANIYALLGR